MSDPTVAAAAPVHLPSLAGATAWLNSEPLDRITLRGRVVLVNFWTLTCINWLRQEPYVRAWSQAYGNDGLVVVGVHTPEFSFEHDTDLVRRATQERAIDYPVAVDNHYAIWGAFANAFWPALYFVDPDGVIRDEYFGEGRYEESERVLQQLLRIRRTPVVVEAAGVEAQADWEHLLTPEIYLGYARGRGFASPAAGFDEPRTYELPSRLKLNTWGLGGAWRLERERAAVGEGGATLACTFHARDAHVVLARRSEDPVPFQVRLDGAPPGPSHGVDVDQDGSGIVDDGGLYQLVRTHDGVRERTLEVTFSAPGAEAYAFTFG